MTKFCQESLILFLTPKTNNIHRAMGYHNRTCKMFNSPFLSILLACLVPVDLLAPSELRI